MAEALDGVSPEVAEAWRAFLDRWGHLVIGDDPSQPTLTERPGLVRRHARGLVERCAASAERRRTAREQTEAEAREALTCEALARFEALLERARAASPCREEDIADIERPNQQASPLSGTLGAPGTATGTVRIVRGPQDDDRGRPGDVTVCPTATPASTRAVPRAVRARRRGRRRGAAVDSQPVTTLTKGSRRLVTSVRARAGLSCIAPSRDRAMAIDAVTLRRSVARRSTCGPSRSR